MVRFMHLKCIEGKKTTPFSKAEFILSENTAFSREIRSRNVVFVSTRERDKDVKKELETNGYAFSKSGVWLLPIWSHDELLGVLLLDFEDAYNQLNVHEETLLNFFSRQVSVVLEHAIAYSREKHISSEMELLQRASVEMLRIASKNEEMFWLTVLTVATANFGLGFNRALLFLHKNNRRTLYARAAVGHNNKEAAEKEWTRDEEREYSIEAFLADAHAQRISLTPLHVFLQDKDIPVQEFGNKIRNVLAIGQPITLSKEEAVDQLPQSIKSGYVPFKCAVLPISAGESILGFAIVDNAHTQKALSFVSLRNLQSLLTNAGLVWETLQQRAMGERLLDVNYKILGGANYQTLEETLNSICKTARKFSDADFAIILPIIKNDKTLSYEFENNVYGHAGQFNGLLNIVQEELRPGGFSIEVLHKGEFIVNDFDNDNVTIDLPEEHFVHRENIKSMVGIIIKDPHTREPLGLIYLDYLKKRFFSKTEIKNGKSFAHLAAIAISNDRRNNELRQRELLKTAYNISVTIGTEIKIDDILEKILGELLVLFQDTTLCVLLYDEANEVLRFAPKTLQYYTIENPEYKNIRAFPVHKESMGSIACKIARKALITHKQEVIHIANVRSDFHYLQLSSQTTSELCVSLMSGKGELLGVLALEQKENNFFDEDDIALVKAVAGLLGQAIDRSQQSQELAFKSRVASMTAWASDLAHDINSKIGRIRGKAYLITEITDNEKIVEFAKDIDENAKALSNVGPWSSVAKERIQLEPFLHTFLKKVVSQRNISLTEDFQAANAFVKANPYEFKRVLRHLVRNSARAMKVSNGSNEMKIDISTKFLQSKQVEIIFRDYGSGISDDIRPAIFHRNISTKADEGGSGLLIVRQLMDDMGGKISLLPAGHGKGAVFSIRLPID
jgi:GAF domain-containing protein